MSMDSVARRPRARVVCLLPEFRRDSRPGFDEAETWRHWGVSAFTLDDMNLRTTRTSCVATGLCAPGAITGRRTAWDTLLGSRWAAPGGSGAQPVTGAGARSSAESTSGRVSTDVRAVHGRYGVAR